MGKTTVAFVAVALMFAACGGDTGPVGGSSSGEAIEESMGTSAPPTTLSGSPSGLERPPDLRVRADGIELLLSPYSYCWFVEGQGVCADGVPQEPLPTLTLDDSSELSVWFPLDWQLWATLLAGGEYCNGAMVIDADPQGSPLETLGPAGTYRVEVFGRGQHGDAAWAFKLVTSKDRSSPPPYVQVFWFPSDRDLEADTPFYAQVGNILAQPTEVSATVVVEASNGESEEFVLSVIDDGGCWASNIGLEGPAQFTAQVLGLGPPPYAAILTVTIDGRTITGTPLLWPDDFPANSNESRRVAADSAP